jgi:CelD/BcsL family acetyltransferase involved in cellulose biosynthesis
VHLRRYDVADPVALQRFYELEESGWKGRQKTAINSNNAARRFHDEIARAAERFGYFSLYLLEFGDQVAAGHFGLTYGGRYYTPKVAYDEKLAAYGPGHLIVDAVLQDCLNRGVQEFDFLGPSMDWKLEWTQQVRRHSDCYVFRRGPFGAVLYTAKFKVHVAMRGVARHPAIAAVRRKLHK